MTSAKRYVCMPRFQTPVAMSTGAGPREKMLCTATSGLLLAVDDVCADFWDARIGRGMPDVFGLCGARQGSRYGPKDGAGTLTPAIMGGISGETNQQRACGVAHSAASCCSIAPILEGFSFSAEHDRYGERLCAIQSCKRGPLCTCKARSMLQ